MPKYLNILFASSEAVPFIKTGGLADVSGSLPKALSHLGLAVSVIIPAYREVLASVVDAKVVSQFSVFGFGKIYYVKLIEARVPSTSLTFWFIDIPELFDRPHGIYLAEDGKDWGDNGERFSIFSKAVTEVAMNRVNLDWKADVVHSNDWQTGLISVFLKLEKNCPKTVFTIHNMAYQGSFPYEVFKAMNLPEHWWDKDGLEFYGNFSMLKAGVLFSDIVTTVSPTYAEEICTPRFAYGLEGVMRQCQLEGKLFGILNGIDQAHWNPQKDTLIPYRYSASYRLTANKFKNKQALLSALGVGDGIVNLEVPLFGLVGRLIEQKGIDRCEPWRAEREGE
ncbi:glycogen synthase [Caedibacter taeniospiralis]|jgi:starch synthase|uniref:glycogen synthase n=1 Tax=Caedibacter taeniospiralis TaxID=28907 RepID=UPI0037C11565